MTNLYPIKAVLIVCSLVLLASFSTQAEIIKQSDKSFTVKHSFTSKKSISTAKHQFGHAGWWWASEFTQSGKGNNMFFNGEGLHERMPNGDTVTHLIKIKRGQWKGALGKLINQEVEGHMKVSIEKDHSLTKVVMEYTIRSGKLKSNESWPRYIDNMLATQMKNLKSSLENR